MKNQNTYSSSLSRGLGGMFVFAALQFLETNDFLLTLIVLAAGVINMMGLLWYKRWTALILLGVNAGLSAIIFYKFLQLDTKYLQWMWLLLLAYYIYRLRELGKEAKRPIIVETQKEEA